MFPRSAVHIWPPGFRYHQNSEVTALFHDLQIPMTISLFAHAQPWPALFFPNVVAEPASSPFVYQYALTFLVSTAQSFPEIQHLSLLSLLRPVPEVSFSPTQVLATT